MARKEFDEQSQPFREALYSTLTDYGTGGPETVAAGDVLPMRAEQIASDPPAWNVYLKGPNDRDLHIAKLVATAPGEFRLHPTDEIKTNAIPVPGIGLRLRADSLEEAMDNLKRHTCTVVTPVNKLQESTMCDILTATISRMNRLACESGSLRGYAVALAMAWGALIAEDLDDDQDTEAHLKAFTALSLHFARRICANHEQQRVLHNSLAEVLAAGLADMIRDLKDEKTEKPDLDEPVKH